MKPCSAAHRGSSTSRGFRPDRPPVSAPVSGSRPGQSGRQTGWNGSASTTASRTTGSRSTCHREPRSRKLRLENTRKAPGIRLRWAATPGRGSARTRHGGRLDLGGDQDAVVQPLEPHVDAHRLALGTTATASPRRSGAVELEGALAHLAGLVHEVVTGRSKEEVWEGTRGDSTRVGPAWARDARAVRRDRPNVPVPADFGAGTGAWNRQGDIVAEIVEKLRPSAPRRP